MGGMGGMMYGAAWAGLCITYEGRTFLNTILFANSSEIKIDAAIPPAMLKSLKWGGAK